MLTKRLLLLLLLLAMVAAVHLSGLSRYVTLESLKEHRDLIEQTVARHYVLSVLANVTGVMDGFFGMGIRRFKAYVPVSSAN
jgi:hypothetical protein